MVAEELVQRHGWGPLKKRFHGLLGEGELAGERLALILPQDYMNRSGRAVHDALRFFRLAVTDLLAVHDEVELAFGDVRLKQGQGLGGHNGLRSSANPAKRWRRWSVGGPIWSRLGWRRGAAPSSTCARTRGPWRE